MYKMLDLGEIFALGEEFNVLHILSVVFVIGGVVGVFMFGIRKSDSQQFPKTVISKSVNVIKKKKRSEVISKPTTTVNKSKEKNRSPPMLQKKSKTDEVPLKKVTSNIASKNNKLVSPANTNQKDKKAKVKSSVNDITDNEGEWRMVVTKKPKKPTLDNVPVDLHKNPVSAKQKENIDNKRTKTNKDAPVSDTKSYPKIEDVIAAMSSQIGNEASVIIPELNAEFYDSKNADWTAGLNKKTKKRALRE